MTAEGEAASGGGHSVCRGMGTGDDLQGLAFLVAGNRWGQKWLKVRLAGARRPHLALSGCCAGTGSAGTPGPGDPGGGLGSL